MTEFNIYEELMPKIQALISPKDFSNKEKSAVDLQQFSKRRGKRYNHDYCDACGEKGSVLYCDICPASFHLLCHDPPLLGADVPGYWSCSSCKSIADNEKHNTAYVKRRKLRSVNEESSKSDQVRDVNSKKDDAIVCLSDDYAIATYQKTKETNSDLEVIKTVADTTPVHENTNLPKVVEIKDEQENTNIPEIVEIKDEQDVQENSNLPEIIEIKDEQDEEENLDLPEVVEIKDELDEQENSNLLEVIEIKDDQDDQENSNLSEDAEIKDELMDVENGGNELELRIVIADTLAFVNGPASEGACRTNLKNKGDDDEKIKSEFELIDPHQETVNDDVSIMNHVWNEIETDQPTNANENKENETVVESRKRSKKNEADECDVFKKMKHTNFNMNVPNGDNFLPLANELKNDSGENLEARSNSVKKRGRPKKYVSNDVIPKPKEGVPRIFYDIIKDAKKMNPRQFTLPVEYIANIDTNLTGCEKDPDTFPNDFDSNDLIKIPPRRCYYCKGICLTGQIVSCDFCTAHFHLNCLNPPLCNIPDVKWMCPLHPHHILDKLMKNSSSITELMKWWNKLSIPLDDDDVRSKFMDKIKLAKKKSTCRSRSSVPIPDIVKYHYKHPCAQIPSLSELLDTESGSLFEKDSILIPQKSSKQLNYRFNSSKEVCLNDIESQAENQGSQQTNEKTKSANRSIIEVSNDDVIVDSTLSVWDNENKRFRFASCGIYDYTSLKGVQTVKRVRKEKPWQSINNIVLRDIDKIFVSDGVLATRVDNSLKQLLAKEKLSSIVADFYPSFLPKSQPYPFFPPPPNKPSNVDTLPEEPKRKVRAVLCPLSHRAPLIFMYGSKLSIGIDFSSDVCLLNYGNCNFISEEHAVIFYDKLTNAYELLNYSEFNTMVDGVSYTCDISPNNFSKENGMNVLNNNYKESCDKVEEVLHTSHKRRISDSNSFSSDSTMIMDYSKSKPTASAVTAAETRSIYKKLLQDIDKLVTKSQQEMATIAEEDLNEISKAIRRTANVRACHRDSSVDNQKSKRKCKEKKKSKYGNDTDDRLSGSDLAETSSETEKGSKSFPQRKSGQQAVVHDLTGSIAMRGAKQNARRSIFNTFHRERKKRKRTDDKRPNDNDEVSEVSVLPVSVQDSDSEYLSSSDFVTCRKEGKCRCQLNDFKFPNGHDASWEEAAPLYHGSYIRFGCIEFIFSIVDYPPSLEDRLYYQMNQPPPPVHEEVNNTVHKEVDNSIPVEIDNQVPKEGDNSVPAEVDNPVPKEGDNSVPVEIDNPVSKEGDNSVPTEVDNPVSKEDNSVPVEVDNTSVVLPVETKVVESNNDVDLSTKLKSILNVLSSKTSDSMSGTGTSSSGSSSRSSRSSSLSLSSEYTRANDQGGRFEINNDDNDSIQIKSEDEIDEESSE